MELRRKAWTFYAFRLSAIQQYDLYDLMVVDRGMSRFTKNQTDAAAASSSSSVSASPSAEGMSITGCSFAR
jgi:hypothetical protein